MSLKKIILFASIILILIYIGEIFFTPNPIESSNDLLLEYYHNELKDSFRSVHLIKEINSAIEYDSFINDNTQIGFHSLILDRQKVILFPNYGNRKRMKEKYIENVSGVVQFLMDYDMTSGYVHPYTLNFYNKLRPTDFVLKYHKSKDSSNQGEIEYVYKKDVTLHDTLGIQIGFFRQWRLSEIDIQDKKVMMKKCTFSSRCTCPQVKQAASNPFSPQIPIWVKSEFEGYQPFESLNKLDDINGGTVVIIWKDKNSHQVKFIDIHGSLNTILTSAEKIEKEYKIDPVIGIYDAGPLAVKVKSNSENKLKLSDLNTLSQIDYVSAGYGYVAKKYYIFEVVDFENKKRKIAVTNDDSLFMNLKKK